MSLSSFLFGDDSSVQRAFELNLQNIAAGVNALTQAGVNALPILEGMDDIINARMQEMVTDLSAGYAQARQDLYSGVPAVSYRTDQLMEQAGGAADASNFISGSYGTTVARGQRDSIATQSAMNEALMLGELSGKAADLSVREAEGKTGLGMNALNMLMGSRQGQADIISRLGMAEAQMRGGISFQGQRSPGFLESFAAPVIGMALGGGINPLGFLPGVNWKLGG